MKYCCRVINRKTVKVPQVSTQVSTKVSTQVSILTILITYFTFFKFLMNIDVKKITLAETGRSLFLLAGTCQPWFCQCFLQAGCLSCC